MRRISSQKCKALQCSYSVKVPTQIHRLLTRLVRKRQLTPEAMYGFLAIAALAHYPTLQKQLSCADEYCKAEDLPLEDYLTSMALRNWPKLRA